MNNANVLVNYCEQHLIKSPLFTSFIKKSPLFTSFIKTDPCFIFPLINEELLNSEQVKLCKIVNFFLKKQIKKNTIFKKEITKLQENSNIVGMKGFFMQTLYYEDLHIRLFNDLDLLTLPEEAYSLFLAFINDGYVLKKSKNALDNNALLIKYWGKSYFKKSCHIELVKEHNNTIILLELHANLNKCKSGNLSFNVNSMIESAIYKSIGGIRFKVFCPEDLIAYLMFHTIKHLSYISLSKNQHKTINLQYLYDVVQVITYENVDWRAFLKKIIQYSVIPFVAVYLKIFTDVYPNIVPCWVVKEIYSLTKTINFKWKEIYNQIIDLTPEALILGDLPESYNL